MKRRDVVLALIAATITPSMNLRAQQGRTAPLLGYIWVGRTAKALGLTIPPTLLARADEVIE